MEGVGGRKGFDLGGTGGSKGKEANYVTIF